VVKLFAAKGRRLTVVDSPNGDQGIEPVPLAGDEGGPLRLEIGAQGAAPGRYAVVVTALRPATPADRTRVQAERLFATGEELRRRRDATSLAAALGPERRSLALLRSLRATAADPAREGDVLERIGNIQADLGAPREALAPLTAALDRFATAQRPLREAAVLNGLGRANRMLGEPRRAIALYRRALSIHRAAGGPPGEGMAVTLHNLGRAQAALGEAEGAFQAYEEALALWQRLGERSKQGQTLNAEGQLYLALGSLPSARDRLTQALALLGPGDRGDTARVLAQLGVVVHRIGRVEEGRGYMQRALAVQRQLGNRAGEAETLANLCWISLHGGPVEAATAPLETCRRAALLYEAIGDRAGLGAALTNLGALVERSGRSAEAAGTYARAVPLLQAAGDRVTQAEALLGLARAQHRRGDDGGAQRAAEGALALVEALRREPASAGLRTSFFASRQELYGFYLDFLMELHRARPAAGYDGQAFAASERAHARTLLDLLGDAGADRAGVPRTLLAREADLGRRLDAAAQRRLWLEESGASAPQREEAAAAERALLDQRERLLAAIRRARPPRRPPPVPLGLGDIQRQVVDRGTLLLEYALGEERSYLWAVTPDRLEAFALPGRATLEAAARRAHALLSAGRSSLARTQTAQALADLSRLLLAPVAARLGQKRLLIVGDGALCYVPFAALPVPAVPGGSGLPGGGQPLVATHEVVTLPSASSLVALRRGLAGRPRAPGVLAVLADPVFELDDPRIAGGRWTGPRPASGAGRDSRFSRLPYSRREAEAILRFVPASARLRALDFDASLATATSAALGRYRILHFATHGVLDTEHPELSGIALSALDARGRPRSGFLRAHEIYRLHLGADLVVLSACATALGREMRGEGLIGLTQGFFHAGARAVLVSLWPVEDLATADLMTAFYRELLQNGRPPAAALRAAQLELLRRPDRAAPASWAGFVLQGDWRP
jgi:CHAT domain-containing protein